MPVSKNGRLYFTDAQYKAARACSALEYARAAGYELVPDGANRYRLQQHDSMIFTADGRWYWNSRNVNGRALEFMQIYEHRSLPEAVELLTKGHIDPAKPPESGSEKSIAPPKKPFELPEKSPSFRRLFAYLCNTRKLDVEIVQELVRQKRIYEGIHKYTSTKTGELRTAHNIVFVGYDELGRSRSAFQRGTNTGASFRGDVSSNPKQYAFCCPGRDGTTMVSVFEASIDAISHATLAKISGMDWRDRDRIAQGGTDPTPLLYYLQHNPQIRRIELCYDNDSAGVKAAADVTAQLRNKGFGEEEGYTITTSLPPADGGKDWNDYLILFRRILAQNMGQ